MSRPLIVVRELEELAEHHQTNTNIHCYIDELERQVEFKIKECQELAQACNRYNNHEKDLQQKFAKLANSANFMRYVIHEKGLSDWADEPRKRMEEILYDENDKLIID